MKLLRIIIAVSILIAALTLTGCSHCEPCAPTPPCDPEMAYGPIEFKLHHRGKEKPCKRHTCLPKEGSRTKSSLITTAPEFVQGFPMLAGENVMLMWNPIDGAVQYRFYEDGKFIGELPEPTLTTIAPSKQGTYKYTAACIDVEGKLGPLSKEGVITLVKATPRGRGIAGRFELPGSPVITLTWEKYAYIQSYEVFRAKSIVGPWKLIGTVSKNVYSDTDLNKGGFHYFYKIHPKDEYTIYPLIYDDILEVMYK